MMFWLVVDDGAAVAGDGAAGVFEAGAAGVLSDRVLPKLRPVVVACPRDEGAWLEECIYQRLPAMMISASGRTITRNALSIVRMIVVVMVVAIVPVRVV